MTKSLLNINIRMQQGVSMLPGDCTVTPPYVTIETGEKSTPWDNKKEFKGFKGLYGALLVVREQKMLIGVPKYCTHFVFELLIFVCES